MSRAGLSGNVDLDCIMISNSSDIIDLSYDLDSAALSNPSSDENSSRLYSYILANYGEKILSGQQVSQGTNAELELVYETTGRYPAIRFGELMDYSAGSDTGDIELALEWASGGGIVGYVWNWPMSGSVYQSRTGFDLQKAVSDLDLATVEPAELVEKYDAEEVSAETLAIIDGIDLAAAQLKRLCDAGVPVIFRPLPEASSGIFWWSRDKDSYLWLYKLIYERFTEYHSLTNLIWVWNGQDAEWYPGDEYCDIISLDVYYPSGSPAAGRSGINFFLSARGVSAEKPVALSECSNFPIPDYSAMDRAFWSFASAWTGDYSPGGEYMPDAAWIRFYNSSLVLTLDEIDNNQ